jgi:ribose 1,5-bisphosphokinase PhnN
MWLKKDALNHERAINAGEILHLVGPNGAGKSTLLARIGADHRARRDNPVGALACRMVTCVAGAPAGLFSATASPAICDAGLALSYAASA